MFLFYQAVLENVIRYRIHVWYGNLPVQLKSKLKRLIRTAMKKKENKRKKEQLSPDLVRKLNDKGGIQDSK